MAQQAQLSQEEPEDWVSRLLELDAGQPLPLDELVSLRLVPFTCRSVSLISIKRDDCFLQLDADFLNSEATSEQSNARSVNHHSQLSSALYGVQLFGLRACL